MVASHYVLTQVVNIRSGINSLVTRVHHVELKKKVIQYHHDVINTLL